MCERDEAGSQGFARSAKGKLDMLHAAAKLDDLKVPPSNRLEKPEGNLKGCYTNGQKC